ncbi:MAG: 50S ribosomal protein L18e [Aigarchaeota archaeon]|nr:50S ribosomal protein L18e [Candidatus Pelearchaeum maunauluense]
MPRKQVSLWRARAARLLEPYARRRRFWRRVLEELAKGNRRRREVNVYHLDRSTKPGEVVFVPGKVLGSGLLKHQLTVGAFSFSKQALSKIERAGGQALLLEEFLEKYPDGSGVRIIG